MLSWYILLSEEQHFFNRTIKYYPEINHWKYLCLVLISLLCSFLIVFQSIVTTGLEAVSGILNERKKLFIGKNKVKWLPVDTAKVVLFSLGLWFLRSSLYLLTSSMNPLKLTTSLNENVKNGKTSFCGDSWENQRYFILQIHRKCP